MRGVTQGDRLRLTRQVMEGSVAKHEVTFTQTYEVEAYNEIQACEIAEAGGRLIVGDCVAQEVGA